MLHAASQDLPCLAELGLRPRRLFDTELAARLAGFERVGLAALTEQLLGFTLEKHHSAADWSTRPLPESWLTYAALDVELLVDLRDALDAELDRQGKSEWAAQEFAALVRAGARPPRAARRPVAAHLRHPPGARRAGAGPGPGAVVRPGPDRRPPRRRARAGCCRTRRSSPPPSWTRRTSGRCSRCPASAAGRCAGWPAPGWTALDDARALPDDALPVTPPVDGPAAAAPVGRAGPGGGRPAGPLPGGGDRASPASTTCRRRT